MEIKVNIIYPEFHKNNKSLYRLPYMLCLTDLNKIIKFYAYKMQQRIEELDHFECYKTAEEPDDTQEYEFISVISKYTNYTTSQEHETRLAKKFKERVLQIFEYFKSKSNNQNILTVIQGKIDREMECFIANSPINLGEVFSYVHLITRRGCIVKPPTVARKTRILSKSIIKEPPKNGEKPPSYYCAFNLKRENVMNRSFKGAERGKIQELIGQLWSGIDFDKGYVLRIKDNNENLILKDMLRRNERAIADIKKQGKRKTRLDSSEAVKDSTILTEVKINTSKGWSTKKKRTIFIPKQRHGSTKENISVFV